MAAVYTSQAELARLSGAQFARLADRDGDGEPDPAVIDEALALGDAAIAGYLAGFTIIPADSPIIRRAATEIAREALYTEDRPEHIGAGADRAREDLRALADGSLAVAGLIGPRMSVAISTDDMRRAGRLHTRDDVREHDLP